MKKWRESLMRPKFSNCAIVQSCGSPFGIGCSVCCMVSWLPFCYRAGTLCLRSVLIFSNDKASCKVGAVQKRGVLW